MPKFFPAKYTDAEAVAAMGVKADDNPLNHDKYLDAEAVAAAKADSDIAAALDLYLNPSRARAYRATSFQSIPNNEYTIVQLNGETYDNLGEFDPVTTYRFVAQKAGYYLVIGQVRYETPGDGTRIAVFIYRNGADISMVENNPGANAYPIVGVCDVVYLAAGQYLNLVTVQLSGVAKNLYFGSSQTFMAIHKLSE